MPYLRLLRPTQWIKNFFVFAGLVFSGQLLQLASLYTTLLAFACMCLVSSAVYVINDLHDREEDKLHPRKCNRPIAAGLVSVPAAVAMAGGLIVLGIGGGWILHHGFGVIVIAYFVLQILYTFGFKHAVILDVIAIGLGFVLRAVAGVVVLDVELSRWLVLCTFTLCLFMGFSKRRCELNALAANNGSKAAVKHRKTLAVYTPELLNHMTTLTAGVAIVCFMLYTIDARTIKVFGEFGAKALLFTLPIVVYAIFRFAVLVEHGEVDGPTDVVTRDRPFQIALVLWVLSALLIIYKQDMIQSLLGTLK